MYNMTDLCYRPQREREIDRDGKNRERKQGHKNQMIQIL